MSVELFDSSNCSCLKEVCTSISFLKDVDADDGCTSGELRWSILQERNFVKLKFQNLESHVNDGHVLVVLEKSHEPLHTLHWSWEVEIKSKMFDDVLFHLNELCFRNVFLLFLGKKVDHSIEAWRNRLLQFCGHQDADYS